MWCALTWLWLSLSSLSLAHHPKNTGWTRPALWRRYGVYTLLNSSPRNGMEISQSGTWTTSIFVGFFSSIVSLLFASVLTIDHSSWCDDKVPHFIRVCGERFFAATTATCIFIFSVHHDFQLRNWIWNELCTQRAFEGGHAVFLHRTEQKTFTFTPSECVSVSREPKIILCGGAATPFSIFAHLVANHIATLVARSNGVWVHPSRPLYFCAQKAIIIIHRKFHDSLWHDSREFHTKLNCNCVCSLDVKRRKLHYYIRRESLFSRQLSAHLLKNSISIELFLRPSFQWSPFPLTHIAQHGMFTVKNE